MLTDDRQRQRKGNMQDILGQTFSVGDGRYRVVDVLKLSGETMVYAEETGSPGHPPPGGQKPRRAAFHYCDIAGRLEAHVPDD